MWKEYHITVLEFFPILAAMYTWGHEWENSSIVFYSDNEAVVAILNKQTSTENNVMALLRLLVLKALQLNIAFRSYHIKGFHNSSADTLSRLQLTTFHKLVPTAEKEPSPIPNQILPQSLEKLVKN